MEPISASAFSTLASSTTLVVGEGELAVLSLAQAGEAHPDLRHQVTLAHAPPEPFRNSRSRLPKSIFVAFQIETRAEHRTLFAMRTQPGGNHDARTEITPGDRPAA